MAQLQKAVDSWRFYSLLIPIAAMGVNVITQIVLVRVRRGARFLRSIVEGVLMGFMVMAALETLLIMRLGASRDEIAVFLLVNGPAYLALSYCYFGLANLGQSSIRIRLFADIGESSAGISLQQIAREYDETVLMKLRIQRLVESGDVLEKNGRYFLGRVRLLLLAKLMRALKFIVLGKKSQFE
jgi:uncharacterized membrane protein